MQPCNPAMSQSHSPKLMPKIPSECLHLIIKTIADDADYATLASLLRVNFTFHHATFPFLYSNPFATLNQLTYSAITLYTPQAHWLLDRLANYVPRRLLTDILFARHKHYITTADPQSTNNNNDDNLLHPPRYLACLRHFEPLVDSRTEHPSHLMFPSTGSFLIHFPLTSFMRHNPPARELAMYSARKQKIEENPYQDNDNEAKTCLYVANFALQRDMTWAICSPLFEQLQSLTIPLSDIARYYGAIDRMPVLRKVVFMMDERIMPAQHVLAWLQEEDIEAHSRILQEHKDLMEAMVGFVKRHRALHRNVLCTVTCPENKSWPGCPQSCPPEVILQLQDLLKLNN